MQTIDQIIAQLPVNDNHSIDIVNQQIQLKDYATKVDFNKAILEKCKEVGSQIDKYISLLTELKTLMPASSFGLYQYKLNFYITDKKELNTFIALNQQDIDKSQRSSAATLLVLVLIFVLSLVAIRKN